MQIIKIDYKNPNLKVISKVVDVINNGKIAIVPGDRVYTIVADAFNIRAIKKVFQIKKREKTKPFSLGLYKLEDIAKYAKYVPLIKKIVEKFPGEPFSFILPRNKKAVPKFLNPGYKMLAFRVPFNKVTSTLSKLHRKPIIGTSANISGFKDAYSLEKLIEYFGSNQEIKPDIILDAGNLPFRRPSTIIEIINNEVKVIRKGEIDVSFLEKKIKII